MVLKFTKEEFEAFIRKSKVKRPKFGNVKIETSSGRYDSKAEYEIYQQLLLQQKAGILIDVQKQVSFDLIPAYPEVGYRAVKYKADFVITYANGFKEVIDVKSKITAKNKDYIIKKKLMWHIHKIKIREIIK